MPPNNKKKSASRKKKKNGKKTQDGSGAAEANNTNRGGRSGAPDQVRGPEVVGATLPLWTCPGNYLEFMEGNFERLVEKLCPDFVPDPLKDPHVLSDRLIEVFFTTGNFERLEWLSCFLFHAFLTGNVNQSVLPPGMNESYPLIILLSQWKQLHYAYGFLGADDFVEISVKLGADVNVRLPSNRVNSLFFAVKYASIHSVNLLIDAGIDVHARGIFGRTCLWNALEYPNPDILLRLLEFLPATEEFHCGIADDDATISVPDRLLSLFIWESVDHWTQQHAKMPASWMMLGRPPTEDLARALVIVLRRGITFAPQKVWLLSLFFGGCERHPDSTGYEIFLASREQMKAIGKFLVGLWLPESTKQDVFAYDIAKLSLQNEETEQTCPICLGERRGRKKLELYCGHSFCLDCIVEHGEQDSSAGATCPVCRELLCLELSERNHYRGRSLAQLMGIRSVDGFESLGPTVLSEGDVLRECGFRGIEITGQSVPGLRDKLVLERRDTHMELELGATIGLVSETLMVMAPLHGAAVISIFLKSVPVLAYLSNRSPCSIVSPEFAKNFALTKKNLVSRKLRDFSGRRINTTIAALEEFEIVLGTITVKLDSAVELESSPDFLGIQLGMDFFMSAALW